MLGPLWRLCLFFAYFPFLISPKIVSGAVTFTAVTPLVRAITGETARLNWTYTANKDDFGNESPIWYKLNGTKKVKLMYDNGFASWALTIAPGCPDAYKTRIGREGVATMFIRNVNEGDTGNYSCVLVILGATAPHEELIELIVSDPTPAPTPTSSSTPPLTNSSSSSTTPPPTTAPAGSNTGAIAGGVIGGVVVLGLAAFVIWYCCKKKKEGK